MYVVLLASMPQHLSPFFKVVGTFESYPKAKAWCFDNQAEHVANDWKVEIIWMVEPK